MRWILFVVLLLLVGTVAGLALLPMSVAADYAAKHVPGFKFAAAAGSVWDGKLSGVSYNGESLGDVGLKFEVGQIFTGHAGGRLSLARKDFTGESTISFALLGDEVKFTDVKLLGQASAVPVLPPAIRAAGGKFTLTVKQIVLDKNVCRSATGELWTDALAMTNFGHGWKGPELKGPVSCQDGKVTVQAAGKAETGEDVTAGMEVGADLSFDLQSRVLNATPPAVETLTGLGFQQENGAYVLRRQTAHGAAAS